MLKKIITFIKVNPQIIIALLFSFFIVIYIGTVKPVRYGDGLDYYMMAEGFVNHASPDVRDVDVKTFNRKARLYKLNQPVCLDPTCYGSFYISNTGKYYPVHFWMYPLISVPSLLALRVLGMNELKLFQVTNAVLLGIAMLYIAVRLGKMKLPNISKVLLVTLIAASPILWFIHWTHTEVFSYVCVVLALFSLFDKRYVFGMLMAALGATQNVPIAFLFVPLLVLYAADSITNKTTVAAKLKDIVLILVAFGITLAPIVFNYVNYSTWNIIDKIGGTSFSFISFKRIFELFFDLNLGIFWYYPLFTIAIFGVLGFCAVRLILQLIRKRESRTVKYWFEPENIWMIQVIMTFITMILMLMLSAGTFNWNHGTSGPSRYSLWSVVPLGWIFVYAFISHVKIKFVNLLIALGIALNAVILVYGGGVLANGKVGFLRHSYAARTVLKYMPSLYNPTMEIFKERTLHSEHYLEVDLNVIYTSRGICKKALVPTGTKYTTGAEAKCGQYKSKTCYPKENFCYFNY